MNDRVATYLNDHLAGSVVALELLSHLQRQQPDTPVGRFAAELLADIASDREQLVALMERLAISRSHPRKAIAWLAEKATELKLHLDDPTGGALRRLEVLEVVAPGIEGKRLLWRARAAAAEGSPRLRGPGYPSLEQRAREQRDRVETFRLEAARAALGSEE
jgi:hypothetical protein